MRLEVAGTFLDGPLARGETDKSQSLGAGNSKASTKKATAACQIEFSVSTGLWEGNFRVQTESMVLRFIPAVLVIRLARLSGKLSLES